MKKLSVLMMVFVCIFSICLVGCKKKTNDNTIRVSEVTHSIFYAPFYVAENMGYFDEQGIKISLTNAGGSDAVMTSLVSGDADVGLMGPESLVYVRNQGLTNAPIAFAQLTNCDGSFLVGREDEADDWQWENLRGKRIIGGRRGGMPAMILQYILENHNLTLGTNTANGETYIDTSIDFALNVPSFLGGTGDYCTMFEPTASQTELDGNGYIVAALGEELSDIPYTAFCSTAKYLNNHSDKLQKFMVALKKGYDYLMSAINDQIVASLKPSFSTTSDELILKSVKNYIRIGAYADNFVLSESAWNTLLDILDNAGELNGARVSYTDAVNTQFASLV